MISSRKAFAAIASLAMVAAPVVASAAPAAKSARVSAPAAKKSKFAGIPIAYLIVGGVALVTAIVVAADGSNSPG